MLVPSFSGEGFVCVSGFWGATRAQRFKPVVGLFLFFFFFSLYNLTYLPFLWLLYSLHIICSALLHFKKAMREERETRIATRAKMGKISIFFKFVFLYI